MIPLNKKNHDLEFYWIKKKFINAIYHWLVLLHNQ